MATNNPPNTVNNDEPTQGEKLKDFYGSATATKYAGMMEDEMVKYRDDFDLIFKAIQETSNNSNFQSSTSTPSTHSLTSTRVLDTCCGSGHMLKYIGENVMDCELTGRDLSPDMVKVAKSIIPQQQASLHVGNMLDMSQQSDNHYQLVLNNFAMHHATAKQAEQAIKEYARILAPNGCLFFSAWEGIGRIDYGDDMEFDANLHPEAAMKRWVAETAGLVILKCRSFVEEEMGDMNSVYIVAQKPA